MNDSKMIVHCLLDGRLSDRNFTRDFTAISTTFLKFEKHRKGHAYYSCSVMFKAIAFLSTLLVGWLIPQQYIGLESKVLDAPILEIKFCEPLDSTTLVK